MISLLFGGCRGSWAWAETYGTARRLRLGSGGNTRSVWACGSVSVCSGGWAFYCANRALPLLRPIPNGRRRKKKLQQMMRNDQVDLWATDEVHFQQHGSRCRMWVPPETKDPVLLHHPNAAKRRSILGAVRLRDWKIPIFSGDRQIQRCELLSLHEEATAYEHLGRPPSSGHYG